MELTQEQKDALEQVKTIAKHEAITAFNEKKTEFTTHAIHSDEFKALVKETAEKMVTDMGDKIIVKEANGKQTALNTVIDELQNQHNKFAAKVNGQVSQITPKAPESFEEVLGKAMTDATDEIAKFQRKETKSLVIDLKAVGDFSTGNVTGGSRYGQVFAPQIIQNQNRKVHMDQILPGGNIGPGNTFTFMRENGQGEGAITPVAEGALKPQFDLDLVEATVNIETIAGWMRVTRKAMNNIPGFISFLQARLPEKFRRVVDQQVLYGNGTTPNLKGILTAGNFVASTAAASEVLIEKLITDISVLEDTYERDATGILLRPLDYYSFFKNKAEGSGEYDLPMGVTFEGGQLRLFGIPMWASTAVNATDYVVGDFASGAQLLTQEGMRIEFFEQDGTNVRENKVTVRIEGNYALPVYGNDYFIRGNTTVTPPAG